MRTSIIAAMTTLAVIAALACNDSNGGSGGALTLDEYFAELERIGDDADTASDEIELPGLDADASFDESRAAFVDYFEQATDIVEDGVQDIRALDPPDEASDAHDRYVEGLAKIMDASNDLLDEIEDADEEEFDEILGGEDPFEAIDDEVTEACADLQAIADDNGVDVDLDCDEEND